MIDKNGKLFGKINIIDAIIVIILLAALLFGAYKFGLFSPEKATAAVADKIRLVFYQEEVNNFTVENAKLQDPVTETLQNAYLGDVVDIKADKSVSWGYDKDGRQVKSTKEGYSSVLITTETTGTIGSSGILTGGSKYYIGQLMTLRVGTSTFYCRLYEAEKVQED